MLCTYKYKTILSVLYNEDLCLEKSFSESDIHVNYQQHHLHVHEKWATLVTRFFNTPQHPSKQITNMKSHVERFLPVLRILSKKGKRRN